MAIRRAARPRIRCTRWCDSKFWPNAVSSLKFGTHALSLRTNVDLITIRHVTRYRYSKPVWFGEHVMMFRPRESFDQHVLSSSLKITPKPSYLRHHHDVFGNCVGVARFEGQASELTFESVVRLEHTPEDALDQSNFSRL